MARAPKNATIQSITSTELVQLDYTVPQGTVSTASLVLTNATNAILDIDVYINDGTTDYLLVSNKIPAGIGKTWFVKELSLEKLNPSFSIKVQSSTTDTFNVFLSVSEITE